MANENPNPLFAYVEARIAAWQTVLASLKSALAIDPGGQTIEGLEIPLGLQNGESNGPVDLPDGAFLGKSIPACVKIYLSAARKKKTLKEVASALRDGGVETTSDNFEGSVYTALLRLKNAGEVLRFKDGWGLSEWYPANLRGSAAPVAKKPKSKKKTKKAKADAKQASPKTSDSDKHAAKSTETTKPEEKTEPRVIGFLRAHHSEASAKDIANALGLKIQTAHLILGKLVHQKKLEKAESGNFKLAS